MQKNKSIRMKLSQFRFNLPKELIAEKPPRNRDEARMMVLHRDSGKVEHRIFKDFIEYVDEGDVVVANNTRVFPALLDGEKEKTGARIQVFLLRELNSQMRLWDVIVDPARKIRIGNKLYFGTNDALVAEVVDNTTSRGRTIRFLFDGSEHEFRHLVKSMGRTPLPDELRRLRDAGRARSLESPRRELVLRQPAHKRNVRDGNRQRRRSRGGGGQDRLWRHANRPRGNDIRERIWGQGQSSCRR